MGVEQKLGTPLLSAFEAYQARAASRASKRHGAFPAHA
jgi:hypothetical protein